MPMVSASTRLHFSHAYPPLACPASRGATESSYPPTQGGIIQPETRQHHRLFAWLSPLLSIMAPRTWPHSRQALRSHPLRRPSLRSASRSLHPPRPGEQSARLPPPQYRQSRSPDQRLAARLSRTTVLLPWQFSSAACPARGACRDSVRVHAVMHQKSCGPPPQSSCLPSPLAGLCGASSRE